MTEPEDSSLVSSCLKGNAGAFEILVERYQRQIFNAALRMVKDYDDARDLTQTAFVKAYERLDSFDPRHKFFSWIYRIVINEAINFLKWRRQHEALNSGIAEARERPDVDIENDERTEMVQEAIYQLRVEQRVLIVLRHFAELSYRELAYVLEVPEKTVKSRLFSARQALCTLLAEKGVTASD